MVLSVVVGCGRWLTPMMAALVAVAAAPCGLTAVVVVMVVVVMVVVVLTLMIVAMASEGAQSQGKMASVRWPPC